MTDTSPRRPLTRERVLRAAVELVDREGLGALTMRRLGAELGVEAMSLYKHVANKDEIIDGIVEVVIAEIELPTEGVEWREAMKRRAISAREVLGHHSWAIGLLEARRLMGEAPMRYQDAILGSLRSAGFSLANAAHAFWLLDAYVYGQVVQETLLSARTTESLDQPAGSAPAPSAESAYPHVAALTAYALESPFSFDGEFEFGLDLILDGLHALLTPSAR